MVEITKSKLAMWHLPGATWTWPSRACDVYCNIGKPRLHTTERTAHSPSNLPKGCTLTCQEVSAVVMMHSADSRVAGVRPSFACTALRAGRPLAPTLARQVGLMTQFCMLCRCIASGF